MKKELSKVDYMIIGLIIGIVIMGAVIVEDQIKTSRSCEETGSHEYIARCSKCGDILTEDELKEMYCEHE